MSGLTRRRFLKLTAASAAGAALFGPGCSSGSGEVSAASDRRQPAEPRSDQAYLAVARGSDPAAITRTALAALGGIERFVRSGDDVIIKPNICVDYHSPEYAATTNPTVVATLVSLCQGAGATQVRVMDTPFGGTPQSAYAVSGIEQAARALATLIGPDRPEIHPNSVATRCGVSVYDVLMHLSATLPSQEI